MKTVGLLVPTLITTVLLAAAFPLSAQARANQPFVGRLAQPTAEAAADARPTHHFFAFAGQRIAVRVSSDDFDTVLWLVSPAGDSLFNDDYGDGTNSRIITSALEDGPWQAIVSSYGERGEGEYLLEVSLSDQSEVRDFGRRRLDGSDSISAKGLRYDSEFVRLEQPAHLVVEMTSDEFEPMLIVEGPDGRRFIGEGDGPMRVDRGGTPLGVAHTTVEVPMAEPGAWRIIATHGSGYTLRSATDGPGSYTLRLLQAPITADQTGEVRVDSLTVDDPRQIEGEHFHSHEIRHDSEDPFVIDLMSSDFDAYLAVRSPSGRWFRDDDGGDGTDSRLELLGEPGVWLVIVTTFSAGETGSYRLTITR